MSLATRYSLAEFEESLSLRGRSASTARTYLSQMRSFQVWTDSSDFGEEKLAYDIARWIQHGREQGDASSTVRIRVAAARAYLRYLGEELGPLADYKAPPAAPPAPTPLPGGMDDVRRMIDASSDRPSLQAAVALGGLAGLRISESIKANWKDVNWFTRRLTVRGKGDKTRVLPVSSELEDVLRIPSQPRSNGAFCGLTDFAARKQITRLAYDCGIDDVSSHDLRATFATTVFRKTHDLLLVSKLLGHASVATTQRYVGIDEEAVDAAVVF